MGGATGLLSFRGRARGCRDAVVTNPVDMSECSVQLEARVVRQCAPQVQSDATGRVELEISRTAQTADLTPVCWARPATGGRPLPRPHRYGTLLGTDWLLHTTSLWAHTAI